MTDTQRDRGRKLLFGLIVGLLLFTFIEFASYVAFRIKYQTGLPLRSDDTSALSEDIGVAPSIAGAANNDDRNAITNPKSQPAALRNGEVLHPYLGFVRDPDVGKDISEYGFMLKKEDSSLHRREEGKVIIGIFGGSVAAGFSGRGKAEFIKSLRAFPEFSDKEIVVASYALGGYKQPQQLMALNYLLLLGGELDVVVNLDGYNEIALHHGPNAKQGVFPMYPSAWTWRVRNLEDESLRTLAGAILYLRSWQDQLRGTLGSGPWRHSPTVNFAWKNIDDRITTSINEKQKAINFHEPEAQTYAATGPRVDVPEAQVMDELVEIWSRGSRQMARLSEANGIRYFHFLQPNQYVKNSKPMSAEERAIAIRETVRSQVAERGYERLIEEGQALRDEGVSFFDLTMIFEETEEPTYSDACCHLNQRGKQIEGKAIAAAIAEHWDNSPATKTQATQAAASPD